MALSEWIREKMEIIILDSSTRQEALAAWFQHFCHVYLERVAHVPGVYKIERVRLPLFPPHHHHHHLKHKTQHPTPTLTSTLKQWSVGSLLFVLFDIISQVP